MIESSRDGILLIDMRRRVQVVNSAALNLLGLPGRPDDWRGEPLRKILHTFKQRSPNLAGEMIAEARRVKTGDAPAGSGKGELPPRIIEWHNLPVRQGASDAIRLLVLRDVTQEEQAIRLRNDLTQTMVHDLRNPLTAISGAVELLTLDWQDALPGDPPPMLRVIEQNSARMMNLTNTIMDIARLESHTLTIYPEAVHLNEAVAETFALQTPLSQTRQVLLENLVSPGLPAIQADRRLLAQTLQNLIDNALKFTPAGGRVRVSAALEGEGAEKGIVIAVQDSGPGIPAELQPQLFQKFVTGKHERKGSGLGLAFCRLAVEAHGGRIWLENSPEPGALFKLRLPCPPAPRVA
jgi:signal transduction histidine kinase